MPCRLVMRTPPHHLWNHYGFVSDSVYFNIAIHAHFHNAAPYAAATCLPNLLIVRIPLARLAIDSSYAVSFWRRKKRNRQPARWFGQVLDRLGGKDCGTIRHFPRGAKAVPLCAISVLIDNRFRFCRLAVLFDKEAHLLWRIREGVFNRNLCYLAIHKQPRICLFGIVSGIKRAKLPGLKTGKALADGLIFPFSALANSG